MFPITHPILKTSVAGGGSVSQQMAGGAKGNGIKMVNLGQNYHFFKLNGTIGTKFLSTWLARKV